MATSSLCFLKFWCCDMLDWYWAQDLASAKVCVCVCVCVFCSRQFRILPALQTVFTLQIEEKKDQSQLELSQKLFGCQKSIKPLVLYDHQLAVLLKFIWGCFLFRLWIFVTLQVDVFWCFCWFVVLLVGCASFNTSVCGKQCKIYIYLCSYIMGLIYSW
jgi:hypothetical protein